MKKIVFPDVKLLLRFLPLDEIDLLQLLDCTEAEVLFTLIVTEELVRCQWEHPTRELRQQAKRCIKQIEAWLEHQRVIHPGVITRFLGKRPNNDTMKEFDLNWQHQDDLLLGIILEYKQTYPDRTTILLTGDENLAGKARLQGIEGIALANRYKLADSGLPTENQQQEMAGLRYRNASLSLSFIGRQDKLTARLAPQLNALPAVMQAQLVAVADNMRREMAQHRSVDLLEASSDDLEALAAFATRMSPIEGGTFQSRMATEETKRYQQEVEAYPEKFERYLHRCLDLINEHNRTIRLNLEMVNRGGAQAEKVRLTLTIPEQLEWYWQPDQNHMPAPPTPPTPPDPEGQLQGKGLHIGKVSSVSSSLLNQDFVSAEEPVGALPMISETGTKLQWELGSYHHRESRPLRVLYIRFRTAADIANFTITYTIQESNSPYLTKGQLLVFANKLSDTENG